MRIWENIKGLWSLVVGLSITLRVLFKKNETVHYPRQVVDPEILESYRGPLQLKKGKDDPAVTSCISCQMCVKACPSNCLLVVKGEDKKPVEWKYDFTLCCLCGSCEEVCPTKALEFSHRVYMTSFTRAALHLDLLDDLAKRCAKK